MITWIARFALGLALSGATFASATVLTSNINMDNGFAVYISTSDSATGTLLGAHNDWPTTYTDMTALTAGIDYYLHVWGYDQGGPAAFLGQFSMSGADHVFSNGLTALLTNTTNWTGNATGFNGTYGALNDLGPNNTYPWNTRPDISADARWIWSGDYYNNDNAYFTTKISAVEPVSVPEPVSLALLGLGLAGLGFSRRRKA